MCLHVLSCVLCCPNICVFTFLVPCCDVRYDFSINMMFDLSLHPVVCRRAHVFFTLLVFVLRWNVNVCTHLIVVSIHGN
jgi:hypothetical protein